MKYNRKQTYNGANPSHGGSVETRQLPRPKPATENAKRIVPAPDPFFQY